MAKTRGTKKKTKISTNTLQSILMPNKKWRLPTKPKKRSRLGNTKGVLPHSISELGGELTQLTKEQTDTLYILKSQTFAPCIDIHTPTLDQLNIATEVKILFTAIGWQQYLTLNYSTFLELCWEFYSTFKFVKPDNFLLDTPNVVSYRLLGVDLSHSIIEFNYY